MFPEGDYSKFRYSSLLKPDAETQILLNWAKQTSPTNQNQTEQALPVRAVISTKGSPGDKLVIHSKRGDISAEPSPDGTFVLQFDRQLYEEDPWVTAQSDKTQGQ